jgi:uncharacterized protein (TIGR02147 family)
MLEVVAQARTTRRKPSVDVFDYLDYRQFLRAFYEAEKQRRPSFSYRFLARQAGLRSPNFLKLVIDGERNLGPESVPKVIAALGLSGDAAHFFADLVTFTQAPSVVEKNRAFERIASSRRFRSARRIAGDLFTYLSHWYYPAVRELTARPDFQEDPKWIARQLRPPITAPDAERALALLLSLGLVVRDDATGRIARGEPTLTTEHEVSSLAVKNFHRQMLERAADAIDTVKPHQRDMAALTACVSVKTAALVKERIHRFREELAELCDQDETGEAVYQLNIQWFPLSVTPDDSDEGPHEKRA